MSNPLIFIHYGDAGYLRYTLDTAQRSNPDKRIILLGDDSNRKFCRGKVEHIPFSRLETGNELAEFDRIFQVIQGERHRYTKLHGTEFWLRFVFRRWFLMLNFLRQENIDAFWTFDSDTLVLAPLTAREERFRAFDCTEQCGGRCLNGYVSSRQIAESYTAMIIALYKDDAYLAEQRERLKVHMGLSFNEMDAYVTFRDRTGLKTWAGSEPLENEAFDDTLAHPGWSEAAPKKILGKTVVKRLWAGPQGGIFIRRTDNGSIVRLVSCNMSWMPDFLYRRLAQAATTPETDARVTRPPSLENLREVSLDEPPLETLLRRIRGRLKI